MSFYTIRPTSKGSVTDTFHKRATPIHYTKYEVVELDTRSNGGGGCCDDDQTQTIQRKVKFYFSCMSDDQ